MSTFNEGGALGPRRSTATREVSSAYKRYLLTILLPLLSFNLMDRFALGMVLQSIKTDLVLSDTQLGFMSGIAFALFYAVMGIPIARWADRGNRVAIISLTAALWSLAVAACGLAANFGQLLLIRVGVAVGEAGGTVPAFSLLADYFDRDERPRALAIYQLGGPLSIVFGYLLAGWLNELYGWRVMFLLLGAPGLVLAVLARWTLREPRRLAAAMKAPCRTEPVTPTRSAEQPSLRDVCRTLWATVTFRHLLLCVSVQFFFMYGILQWQPTYFVRSFALTSAQVGARFAVIYGLGSLLGTYLGGAWASRYAARNERLQLRVGALAMGVSAVLSACAYGSSHLYLALGLSGAVMFAQTAVNGPLFATIQSLVPERMRAVATGVVLLFSNLMGLGLGPLAAGALSDALRPWAGEASLRYALLILSPGLLWTAWHAWRASQTVTHDLDKVQMPHAKRAGTRDFAATYDLS